MTKISYLLFRHVFKTAVILSEGRRPVVEGSAHCVKIGSQLAAKILRLPSVPQDDTHV